MIQATHKNSSYLHFLKYFEIWKISYFDNVAYISEVIGLGVVALFRVWIFAQLYRVAFFSGGVIEINGLNFERTVWLLSLTQCFFIAAKSRKYIKDSVDDIKSGNIAQQIAKPYNYQLAHLFSGLGIVGANIFTSVLITVVALLLLVGPIEFTITGLVLGLFMLGLGYIITVLLSFIMTISAFWMEDSSPIRWIYDKMVGVFGGAFFPVALLPFFLQTLSEILPFSHLFHTPARIMVAYDPNLFIKLLILQFFWIIALYFIGLFLYRKGIKNLTINGG